MKPVPEEKPAIHKDLSATSQQFDIGHKGFLTPAEKAARSMDFQDEGHLSNEATVHLIERTEELSKANSNLRHWLIAVLTVTVLLGASQIATAIAAARLAKDTETNSDSGVMFVKGQSDKPVMVVPTGKVAVVSMRNSSFCATVGDMAELFGSTITGSPTMTVFHELPETEDDVGVTESVQWSASGTFYNRDKACISATNGKRYCFSYEPCAWGHEEEGDDDENRRLAVVHKHRMAFHEEMKRRLAYADYPCDMFCMMKMQPVGLQEGGLGMSDGPGDPFDPSRAFSTPGANLNRCGEACVVEVVEDTPPTPVETTDDTTGGGGGGDGEVPEFDPLAGPP